MISFIIIGRNEGWKLPKCIQSVQNTINYCGLENSEIIYVDSNSTDNSIERAGQFRLVKIFKITGDVNAAIARNVGAKEAKGDIFFFLDGDMEINKKFFLELFDKSMDLKYPFISGDFCNFYYENNESKTFLSKEMYHKNKKITKNFVTGGLFAIKRNLWESVVGMRNIFRRSQDMDLGLRLSKKSFYLYRLPINLVNHHTVSYSSKNRMWNQLIDSTHLFGRSLLYRKNILNLNTLKLMVKQDYSFLTLIISIIGSFVFGRIEFLFLYVGVLLLRSVLKKNIKYLVYYLARDIKVLFGFLFFHPKKNNFSYQSVL